MINIVLVTTYPAHATKNIGDHLITNSLVEILKDIVDCNINLVWRGASWESVRDVVLSADHVFFAGFAIRRSLAEKQHPFMRQLIKSEIPFSVISAGTSFQLNVDKLGFDRYDESTIALLKEIDKKAHVFSSRGALTHRFLKYAGCQNVIHGGDVAFYQKDRPSRFFDGSKPVKSVVISDPHRPEAFSSSFVFLAREVRKLFPHASLKVVIHSEGSEVVQICKAEGLDFDEIYKRPESGLDIYQECDVHIGYRVHGHVSALKNGKISYLLEQDGRGADYALTLERKMSVASFPKLGSKHGMSMLLSKLTRKRKSRARPVSIAPAEQLISMIRSDMDFDFRRFKGMEEQVERFSAENYELVRQALSSSKLV